MNKLARAAAAAAALGAAAVSTAHAGVSLQGPHLTGIAPKSLASDPPVVTAVTLRSGETIDLASAADRTKR